MAGELSPLQAAEIARSVYAFRMSTNPIDVQALAMSLNDTFDFEDTTKRFEGTTGVGPVRSRTGFAYVVSGRRGTERMGECIVAVRGTQTGYDWLTNFRFAGTPGPYGGAVHLGFWNLASEIALPIEARISNLNPSTIHVVGHSLGGAAATLVADVLSHMPAYRKRVKLYTFAAPRCGTEVHARLLTENLGSTNIFRAYHQSDPVPMLPLWPYSHVPYVTDSASGAYWMKGINLDLRDFGVHLMGAYMDSVSAANTWSELGPSSPPEHGSFAAAEAWLAEAARDGSLPIMLSAKALHLIMSALKWVLKAIGRTFTAGLMATATIVDAIARLLYAGVLLNLRIASFIKNLVRAMFRFLGRKLKEGVELSVQLFQFVLGLLFNLIAGAAHRALDLLFSDYDNEVAASPEYPNEIFYNSDNFMPARRRGPLGRSDNRDPNLAVVRRGPLRGGV